MGAKIDADVAKRMGVKATEAQNLKNHGKELQEKVSGKKCPHCGKPI